MALRVYARIRAFSLLAFVQIKGGKKYDASDNATWLRENIALEKGWLVTSSSRREWMFVQDFSDVDKHALDLYRRINRLGVFACFACA